MNLLIRPLAISLFLVPANFEVNIFAQEEIQQVRAKLMQDVLAFQQKKRTVVSVRTQTYNVHVPVCEQVQSVVLVPIRRREYYWERVGVFRKVLRCREIVTYQQRVITRQVTSFRSESRTRQYQVTTLKDEPLLNDKNNVAANGSDSQAGVIVELGELPYAAGPTYKQMKSFFSKSTSPSFDSPSEKKVNSEQIHIHSKWISSLSNRRKIRVTVSVVPYSRTKLLLSVLGVQLRNGADENDPVAGDFIKKDQYLNAFVSNLSKRIEQALKKTSKQ